MPSRPSYRCRCGHGHAHSPRPWPRLVDYQADTDILVINGHEDVPGDTSTHQSEEQKLTRTIWQRCRILGHIQCSAVNLDSATYLSRNPASGRSHQSDWPSCDDIIHPPAVHQLGVVLMRLQDVHVSRAAFRVPRGSWLHLDVAPPPGTDQPPRCGGTWKTPSKASRIARFLHTFPLRRGTHVSALTTVVEKWSKLYWCPSFNLHSTHPLVSITTRSALLASAFHEFGRVFRCDVAQLRGRGHANQDDRLRTTQFPVYTPDSPRAHDVGHGGNHAASTGGARTVDLGCAAADDG